MPYPTRLSETMAFGNVHASGWVEGLAKIRCKYIPVSSAPPSMASHDFGKTFHPTAYPKMAHGNMQFRLTCINGSEQQWL